MSISGINGMGMLSYVNSIISQRTENARKADSTYSFQNVMQTTSENRK